MITVKEMGVMVVKNNKGWGILYADGRETNYGWVPLEKAEIFCPTVCKKPTDAERQGSPYAKELKTGRLVKVIKTTTVEI